MLTPVAEVIDYKATGPLTSLVDVPPAALSRIADEPVAICWPVHGLVIQPGEAETLGVAAERFEENQIRPAGRLADVLLGLDPAPLSELREPPRRVVGTCRHFAVLACALLRHRGIASRVRCGFATYFQPGQGLDHWIVEYREDTSKRWVRLDPEIWVFCRFRGCPDQLVRRERAGLLGCCRPAHRDEGSSRGAEGERGHEWPSDP